MFKLSVPPRYPKFGILLTLLISIFAVTVSALPCGDCNGDGASEINVLDLQYMIEYFMRGGPPPPDMTVADCDGYAGVTPHDLYYVNLRLCCGALPPICPPNFPEFVAPPDSDFSFAPVTRWVDEGVGSATLRLELFSKKKLSKAVLPFEIRIGSDVPQIDSIWLETSIVQSDKGFIVDSGDGRTAALLMAIIGWMVDSMSTLSFSVDISVSQSTERRPVSINWTKFTPIQAPTPDSTITPMASYKLGETYEPILTCCAFRRGDLNGDGDNANIVDLTMAVDFVFRSSGNRGDCDRESDVNGDGDVLNILDLTSLVDFIFRGGPSPAYCF